MFDKVAAYQYVALRLPSDTVKVEQILPNTLISLGKYGSFHSRNIIGRPYYSTFDILDRSEQRDGRELRIVKASEIHAESILEEAEPDLDQDASIDTPAGEKYDEYGLPTTADKTNVNIIDDPTNQKLTYEEIEALKSDQLSNPKELIAKIMANHGQLDQKTAFSLAKYTLRKQKKYMKRFTILPLDVAMLTDYMMEEKDFSRTMEIRNETLGLIGSWANAHSTAPVDEYDSPRGRYLVVDDTGGLVVAALAERMGILHHFSDSAPRSEQVPAEPEAEQANNDVSIPNEAASEQPSPLIKKPRYDHQLATSNTLTLIHANQQPNLSLLRYFAFDPNQPPSPNDPSPHPLHTHLHLLSWLQLLHPESDSTYSSEPPIKSSEELYDMKANHRSNYHRKRRRWQRTKQVVDTTRAGGYDGLIVASYMEPTGICKHLVPLLKGGAQVVVYSPHLEPIMELCDVYSTARRAAYLQAVREKQVSLEANGAGEDATAPSTGAGVDECVDTETAETPQTTAASSDTQRPGPDETRFPVDPTLLLTPTVHHSVARPWQVLPGRTHPLMMGKGGAEGGYVLVSTRVIPAQGVVVQARGKQRGQKKRAVAEDGKAPTENGEAKRGQDDVENLNVAKKMKVEANSDGDVNMSQ